MTPSPRPHGPERPIVVDDEPWAEEYPFSPNYLNVGDDDDPMWLAYLDEVAVNWCPELGTVLANEEVVNGVVIKKSWSKKKKERVRKEAADGTYDAYWELGLNAWDTAAGAAIALAAGGHITDLSGGEPDVLAHLGDRIIKSALKHHSRRLATAFRNLVDRAS